MSYGDYILFVTAATFACIKLSGIESALERIARALERDPATLESSRKRD